jgi:hypothetical protein
LEKHFDENLEEAARLRKWVGDALPQKTTLVYYKREDAWDGTIAEFWILNCPTGFEALRQSDTNRNCFQIPSDSAYPVIDPELARLGVHLGGSHSPTVWTLDWRTTADKTDVRGTIYPHSGGEMLRIERITLK